MTRLAAPIRWTSNVGSVCACNCPLLKLHLPLPLFSSRSWASFPSTLRACRSLSDGSCISHREGGFAAGLPQRHLSTFGPLTRPSACVQPRSLALEPTKSRTMDLAPAPTPTAMRGDAIHRLTNSKQSSACDWPPSSPGTAESDPAENSDLSVPPASLLPVVVTRRFELSELTSEPATDIRGGEEQQ